MAGGFSTSGFTGGLLGGINNQIADQKTREENLQDYSAKLAADNTAKAQAQDAQDKRDADAQTQQTEEFARLINNGNDPTPGHIAAAHAWLVGTGADTSKMSPDYLDNVRMKLQPMAATINAKLQASSNQKQGIDPTTGSPYAQQTQQALGAPVVAPQTGNSSMQVPASQLQDQSGIAIPATPVDQTATDLARTNVHQGQTPMQGMYPANANQNYNEDFLKQLSTVDPARANMAKQVVMGTMGVKISTRMLFDNKGNPTQLAKDAIQYDPDLNLKDVEERQKLTDDYMNGKGPTSTSVRINSLNQLSLHMAELVKQARTLNNTNSTALNSVIADTPFVGETARSDPRYNTFDTIKNAASDEISRLFRAGVISNEEKESWDKNISHNTSIQGLVGTPDKPGSILAMANLVNDSANGINDKWNTTFNQNVDWMNPRSRAALDYVRGGGQDQTSQGTSQQQPNVANNQPQQQGTPPVHVTSQQDIDNAAPGSTLIVNGKQFTKKAQPQQQSPQPAQQPAMGQ